MRDVVTIRCNRLLFPRTCKPWTTNTLGDFDLEALSGHVSVQGPPLIHEQSSGSAVAQKRSFTGYWYMTNATSGLFNGTCRTWNYVNMAVGDRLDS